MADLSIGALRKQIEERVEALETERKFLEKVLVDVLGTNGRVVPEVVPTPRFPAGEVRVEDPGEGAPEPSPAAGEGAPGDGEPPPEDEEDEFEEMNATQAIVHVLATAGKPLHSQEVNRRVARITGQTTNAVSARQAQLAKAGKLVRKPVEPGKPLKGYVVRLPS